MTRDKMIEKAKDFRPKMEQAREILGNEYVDSTYEMLADFALSLPEMSSKLVNILDKEVVDDDQLIAYAEKSEGGDNGRKWAFLRGVQYGYSIKPQVTDEEIKAKANEMYSTLIHMPLRIIWIEASKWMRELTKTK
jgi:hypothetical protein